jgi:hypothetical protein
MSFPEQSWTWAAFRAGLAGLLVRLAVSSVLVVVLDILLIVETRRLERLGVTGHQQGHLLLIVVPITLALGGMGYLLAYAVEHCREPTTEPFDSPIDPRPRADRRRTWFREWLDFGLPLWPAAICSVFAALCAIVVALFGAVDHGSWMVRGPSPLHLGFGVVWVAAVAIIAYVGAFLEYPLYNLWFDRTLDAWLEAAEKDRGIGVIDTIDVLEYGRHLTLLRRTGGRYSFVHELYRAYFTAQGSDVAVDGEGG